MELEHAFTVAAPVDRAWATLIDLDKVVPCMPGAALTSYDGEAFEGTVKVKLGPVSMTFAGKGRFVERDEASRTMVVEASGRDSRGGGTAKATVHATLVPSGDDATDVKVRTDMAVTGRVAQFGRGMIADVSSRLLGQFTDCLAGKLADGGPAPAAAAAPAADAAPAAREHAGLPARAGRHGRRRAGAGALARPVAEPRADGRGDRDPHARRGRAGRPAGGIRRQRGGEAVVALHSDLRRRRGRGRGPGPLARLTAGSGNHLPAAGGRAEGCRMRTLNGRKVFETDVG